ncbi:MAG: MgtC/SapB family protein [bacterium]|nr:MgtC/SapB family protein [bacterium]
MQFFVDFLGSEDAVLIFRLTLAVFLGTLIGLEREMAHKHAGVRTHALVALGSALFTVISSEAAPGVFGVDPTRIAAQVVTGIGFMGAGLIVFNDSRVRGLTTAAGLWAAAAIGMAVGFGLYVVAIFATFLALFVLVGFWFTSKKLFGRSIHQSSYGSHD